MQNKKINIPLALLFLLISFFVVSPVKTHASILDDAVDKVKDLFTPEPKKEFLLDSNITLAPGGDMDQNGQIDSGDTIRFTYNIKNTTDEGYSFATLKTNIDRRKINFIHNVTGTVNLNNKNNTVTIPNLTIAPNNEITITFDARINYDTKEDQTLSTLADFSDIKNKSIAKSLKKEIRAKKISVQKFTDRMNFRGSNQ